MRNRLAGTLLLLFVFLCTSWAQTSGLRKMIDLSGTARENRKNCGTWILQKL